MDSESRPTTQVISPALTYSSVSVKWQVVRWLLNGFPRLLLALFSNSVSHENVFYTTEISWVRITGQKDHAITLFFQSGFSVVNNSHQLADAQQSLSKDIRYFVSQESLKSRDRGHLTRSHTARKNIQPHILQAVTVEPHSQRHLPRDANPTRGGTPSSPEWKPPHLPNDPFLWAQARPHLPLLRPSLLQVPLITGILGASFLFPFF